MELEFNPWAIPSLAAGVLLLLGAVFVFALAPGKAINRRLAAVFSFEGFAALCLGGVYSVADLPSAFAFQVLTLVCFAITPFAYLLFMARALDARATGWLRTRWVAACLVLIAAAEALAIVLWPEALIQEPFHPVYATWEFHFGPWAPLVFLSISAVAALGIVLAIVTLRRTPRGSARRKQARSYLLAFGITDAFQAVVFLFPNIDPQSLVGMTVNLVMWALSYTTTALLVAYAIVRYQLFGIDLKLKWTLRRGTVAAVLIACFLIGSQLLQNVTSARFGVYGGALLAGLALFAIRPIERMANRFADRAMPAVHDTAEYRTVRKQELYQAALESALQDGKITDKERNVLATLADRLGISATEALAFERRAAAAWKG